MTPAAMHAWKLTGIALAALLVAWQLAGLTDAGRFCQMVIRGFFFDLLPESLRRRWLKSDNDNDG